MGNFVVSLIFAAGVGAFVYAKLGRRIGYGNSANLWTLIGISFVLSFIVAYIITKTALNL